MADAITLLGTGTCQLQTHRMASSVLIERDGLRVVYDMGRGITQRLTELKLRQDDIEHVVLSHFHADHFADLIPFLQAASWSRIDARTKDLHVYGPRGVEVQMARVLGLCGPDELVRPSYKLRVHEIREPRFEIEECSFEFIDLPPAGNHGLRFDMVGKRIALTGDSNFHDQEIEFLRGVQLAVIDSGHISDEEIVELAVQAGPDHLVCTHLYRELDAEKLQHHARSRGFDGKITVGEDLMRVTL